MPERDGAAEAATGVSAAPSKVFPAREELASGPVHAGSVETGSAGLQKERLALAGAQLQSVGAG